MQGRRLALVVALLVTVAATLSTSASSARAADQTVLGKVLVIKDPKPGVDPSLRSVVAMGKELLSTNTIVGDPVANGVTVDIIANGASPSTQTFTLPPGASVSGSPGWKVLGTVGFSYKDALGANGPVKTAIIKRRPMAPSWSR